MRTTITLTYSEQFIVDDLVSLFFFTYGEWVVRKYIIEQLYAQMMELDEPEAVK